MTVILRLQGLDVKAGAEDIRTFFESLHIPDGGVYIVGGSLREAFIAFTTEKDAQLAMRHTGRFLKGSKVALHVSGMEELEHKLKSLLKRKKEASPAQLTSKRLKPSPGARVQTLNASPPNANAAHLSPTAAHLSPTAANLPHSTANLPVPLNALNVQVSNVQSLDSNTAFLLGICTVLQGLQSSHQSENRPADPRVHAPKADSATVSDEARTPGETLTSKPGYARLFGLPASTTKEDICRFFGGLTVQEVIVNVKLGRSHGCLVKFPNTQDACDAMRFNQKTLDHICVEVRGATEKMWTGALQECESALEGWKRVKPKQSPLKETANHKSSALWMKRPPVERLPSRSPKKPRPDGDSTPPSSPALEYTVMVRNLPKEMTKTEIKELFGCPNLAHNNVLHLLDKKRNKTDTAFLLFNRTEDYDYAINLTGCHVGSEAIEVSQITKMMMREMMAKNQSWSPTLDTKHPYQRRKSDPVERPAEAPSLKPDPVSGACLFVRNLPASVRKSQIKGLFQKYKLKMDDIILLLNSDGKATGEAVVQFKSQKLAALAQRLHGEDFLGTKVLLTRINVEQKEDILAKYKFEEVEH